MMEVEDLSQMMIEENSSQHNDLVTWRRWLHQHPELGFQEHLTSQFVAEKLKSFGLIPEVGLGGTGVVASIHGRKPGREIGLRADIDALKIVESNSFNHCSVHKGRMHACGHDGHTVMLLGASKQLAEYRHFSGVVHVIFQPAEEVGTGGKMMMEDGLFERFQAEEIYGMHNWPGLEAGKFVVHDGPVMAASKPFDIEITGLGCHAAMPHLGCDPIFAGSQIITALQSIVSRNLNPFDSAVVSVTRFVSGDSHNIVPGVARLQGTVRYLETSVGLMIQNRMKSIVEDIAKGLGVRATLEFSEMGTPPIINNSEQAKVCVRALRKLVHEKNVLINEFPSMGGEDFSHYLEKVPGAYIWIGNGTANNGQGLHNSGYDFNDSILPLGVNYWLSLVNERLPYV